MTTRHATSMSVLLLLMGSARPDALAQPPDDPWTPQSPTAPRPAGTRPPAAQNPTSQDGGQPVLRQVEQAVGDVGPLRISLRSLKSDLRSPTSFDTVYRLPPPTTTGFQDPGSGADRGMLARANGALVATFPRSIYSAGSQGTQADVPPGTVYWIGGPGEQLRTIGPSSGRAPGPTWVSSAADQIATRGATTLATTSADPDRADADQAAAAPPMMAANQDRSRVLNVFLDSDYAASRVRQLLLGPAEAPRTGR